MIQKLPNMLCLALTVSLLTACTSGSTSGSPAETYNADISANEPSVAGQDTDKDGTRDDVQREISEKYDGPLEQEALKVARSFQALLISSEQDFKTPQQVQAQVDATTNFFIDKTCIYDNFGLDAMKEVGEFVVSRTINNENRARAYQKVSSVISGAIFDEDSTSCGARK
ncbi:hypothetical protein GCM10008959_41650 [Deinococcus seoulensis]|uniref:Lipoprotein n=1 Tax=Deinococcus seoulensis TaxID=1837379 RepID=A0ABQ2RYK6_9DEIO|nr:hypothetical protein [Deinococcus seoulensis]GGR76675.1 hypothetical protein GCM10008959_41650 [Deinococcus seoulensis]